MYHRETRWHLFGFLNKCHVRSLFGIKQIMNITEEGARDRRRVMCRGVCVVGGEVRRGLVCVRALIVDLLSRHQVVSVNEGRSQPELNDS